MTTWIWLLLLLGVYLLGLGSAVRAYFLGYGRAEAEGDAVAASLRAMIRATDTRTGQRSA